MDNVVTALASTFLIGSSSLFHLTWTNIKAWMSLKLCRIRPRTYNGRNVVTPLVISILNGSSLFLQIRRTTIKAWMSLNFVKITSPIMEVAPIDHS